MKKSYQRQHISCRLPSLYDFQEYTPYYLHSNYSIDEEQHGYQECNIGKSLGGKKEKSEIL